MSLILDLLLDALKDPDSGGVVIHAARRTERRLDDGGRRYEVVRKAVVQSALDLEKVLCGLEEVDVALRERLEGLLVMCVGRGAGKPRRHTRDGSWAGTKKGRDELRAHGWLEKRVASDSNDDDGELGEV